MSAWPTDGVTADFGLRDVSSDDVDWITEACHDAEIQRWTLVPRPYTRRHAEEFVGSNGVGVRTWIVQRLRDCRGVGTIGVHSFDEGVANIGYWIAPWARRERAASTAIELVVREVIGWPNAHTVTAHIAETNIGSQAAAARAGFERGIGAVGATCPDGDRQVQMIPFARSLRGPKGISPSNG